MKNSYIVTRIDEPDFGCEGLPDGQIRMDKVYLKDNNGCEKIIEVSDELLYQLEIDEGSKIVLDGENNICIDF